jgi:hypothetical protein
MEVAIGIFIVLAAVKAMSGLTSESGRGEMDLLASADR